MRLNCLTLIPLSFRKKKWSPHRGVHPLNAANISAAGGFLPHCPSPPCCSILPLIYTSMLMSQDAFIIADQLPIDFCPRESQQVWLCHPHLDPSERPAASTAAFKMLDCGRPPHQPLPRDTPSALAPNIQPQELVQEFQIWEERGKGRRKGIAFIHMLGTRLAHASHTGSHFILRKPGNTCCFSM